MQWGIKMAKMRTSNKYPKISGILYSSNDGPKVKAKLFRDLNAYELYKSVDYLKDHRFFRDSIRLNKNNALHKMYGVSCPRSSLEKSVYWAIGVIEVNKDLISAFLLKQDRIISQILNGDYFECLETIDELDRVVGISAWAITIRGSILSLIGDFDAKVEYARHLDELSGENTFISSIAKHISSRYVDVDVFLPNARSFKSQITRSFDGALLNLLLYKLTVKDYLQPLDYESIFNDEKNTSLIDLFECVLNYLAFSTCNVGHDDSSRVFAVTKLNKLFRHPIISNIASMLGLSCDWEFMASEYSFIDLYTEGRYEDICRLFEQAAPNELLDFQYFEIVAKSATRVSSPRLSGLRGKVVGSLIDILEKNSKYNNSLSFLLCLCHSFQPLKWFCELNLFLERERKSLNDSECLKIRNLSIIYSTFNSPRKLYILDQTTSNIFIEKCSEAIPDSLALFLFTHKEQLHNTSSEHLTKIEHNRLSKYIGKSLLEAEEYQSAIRILETLASCDDTLICFEASSMLVEAYIKTGKALNALIQFVDKCLVNHSFVYNYDTSAICDIAKTIAKESTSIYVPVAISLHSRYIDDKYDSVLRFSFEMFLLNNKVELPLDDLSIYTNYTENIVNYFLEHACIPDVMKLYFNLPNTRAIDDCRISICNYLVSKNISKEHLIQEVKDRARKIVIGAAYKQIEKSRIYSDTSIFYNEGSRNKYIQLFDKYCTLASANYEAYEDEKSLSEIYTLFKDKDLLSQAHTLFILKLPLNEKNSTFLTLLQRIRDDFAYGDKGFNYYLSTRIRHGHLPTTLRKCVLDEQLVTKKIANSNNFKPNEYWLGKLWIYDDKVMDKIHKAFSEFTLKYEEEIETINDKWLQITSLDQSIINLSDTKSKSEAIFDFSIGNFESYALQRKVPPTSNYAECVKLIIDWLWQRTDISLHKAREKLSVTARQRLLDLMHSLQKEVFLLSGESQGATDLNDAIGRARAALNTNLEQVISWFTRSEGSVVAHYDIDIAIEIAIRSAFVKVGIVKDKSYNLDGSTLSYIVDLLYILFENAISKSHLPKDFLELTLKLSSEQNVVKVVVTNKCLEVSDINIANTQLEYYRTSYGNTDLHRKNIQGEGGTGFFKIYNILKNLLGLEHSIQFGYITNNSFQVEINITNFEKVLNYEDINC